MAEIKVTGFVDKELTNARGEQFGFRLTETHRKKQDDGSYKTTARTFHTVKGAPTIGYRIGDRVTVTGRQITETWNRDGETRYQLLVWADAVENARFANAAVPQETEHTEDPGEPSWVTASIPDETPF